MRTPDDFAYPCQAYLFNFYSGFTPRWGTQKRNGPHASAPSEGLDIESALLPRRKLSKAERKRSMVTCTAPLQSLVNREYRGIPFEKTIDPPSTHSPFVETKERKEQDALYKENHFQKNTLLQAIENDDFFNRNGLQLIVQDSSKLPLYTFTGTQHKEKFKKLNDDVCNEVSSKEEEKMTRWTKSTSSVFHHFMSKDTGAILFYWLITVTTLICNYMHLYKCSLKWKIHDTLSRLGSSEDTFTQVYVYDLKEIHYDCHNRFWDRPRQIKTSSRYLKQFCDSLNDEYQEFYSGTRRSLGS